MKIPFPYSLLIFCFLGIGISPLLATTNWENPGDSTYVNFEICEGDCLIINGNQYCTAGVFTETYIGSSGCDSVVNITIVSYPKLSVTVPFCEGECIYIAEIDSTLCPETQEVLYFPSGPCPEAIEIILAELNPPTISISPISICAGECAALSIPLLIDTILCPTTDTTYQIIYLDPCPDTLTITINVVGSSSMDSLIYYRCEGECVEFNGGTFCNNYSTTEHFFNDQGCDSLVYFELNIDPVFQDSFKLGICVGECIQWEGMEYCDSLNRIDSLSTISGCDSTVVIHTEIIPLYPQLLPADTTIALTDSLHFEIDLDNFSVFWNTGVDSSIFIFQGEAFGNGLHPVFATIVEESTGCLRFTDTTLVQVGQLQSTAALGIENDIQVFPNPLISGNDLTISFATPLTTAGVWQIHSLQGATLFEEPILPHQQNLQLSFGADLPAGIYLLTVLSEAKSWISKIVIP